MAIYAPNDTLTALGGGYLSKCKSRSLYAARFAAPEYKENDRKNWFNNLIGKNAEAPERSTWLSNLPGADILYGRLMSRMMVDLSGGVMENANLNLDRYGLPRIPGSAVKGCARRMALQALHDWIEAGSEQPDGNDACAPCCEGFKDPAEMLAAIARVFGWVELDWETGRNEAGLCKSDLRWACGEQWKTTWRQACKLLAEPFGWQLGEERPWSDMPDFAGTIAFIEARPDRDPGLELDVVTPHHTKYHDGKEKAYRDAPDTEDPVPVYFPAVKPQANGHHYFSFPLIPLRRARKEDVGKAKIWLATGLELFGIGAKTAAGYGWFATSDEFNEEISNQLEEQKKKMEQDRIQAKQKEDQDRLIEEKRKSKEELTQMMAALSPEEREDKEIELLTAGQFQGKIKNFHKERKKGGPEDSEKAAIIRALRGPRLEIWQDFKQKAVKGEPARAVQAIQALNKQLNKDKMP